MGFFNKVRDGDEFVAVSDGKGGFRLTPKNSGGDLGGCLLVLVAIALFLALFSIVLIPAGMALYAFTKDDEGARRIRTYIVAIFAISALINMFASDSEFVQSVSDLYMSYEVLFNIVLLLNLVGLASAVAGLFGISDRFNKVLTQFSMVGILVFSIFYYGERILEHTPPDVSNRRYFSQEKLDIACDCYRVSYEFTQTNYDDLSSQSDKNLRSKCYDLFQEDTYDLTEDTDALMKRACEVQRGKE